MKLDEAILNACAGHARTITDLARELEVPRPKVARRVSELITAGSRPHPILRQKKFTSRYSRWGYEYLSMLPEHKAARQALALKCKQEEASVRHVLRAVGLFLPEPKREDYPEEWEFEQAQDRVEQHNENLCYHGQVKLTATQFLRVVDFLIPNTEVTNEEA